MTIFDSTNVYYLSNIGIPTTNSNEHRQQQVRTKAEENDSNHDDDESAASKPYRKAQDSPVLVLVAQRFRGVDTTGDKPNPSSP